jgi:hypothetical protein
MRSLLILIFVRLPENIARPQAWKKYRSMNMGSYFSSREMILEGAELLSQAENTDQILTLD